MDAKRPIVVLGTGRSGTTILHRILATHPDLAWLSRVCDQYPRTAPLHRLIMRSMDCAPLGRLIRSRLPPDECYPFWDHLFPGFSEPCRDLEAADVTVRVEQQIQNAAAALTTPGRSRLLLKITGWPRIGFLDRVFPDATFVHVVRDGRAVANSLLAVDFWRGWRGPDNWRWGPLTDEHSAEWEAHGRSFVVLAGLQWKILMDAAEAACARVDPARVHLVRHEDLCEDPLTTVRTLAESCDLRWSPSFEADVRAHAIVDANARFRTELTSQQQAELEQVLSSHLCRHGYL